VNEDLCILAGCSLSSTGKNRVESIESMVEKNDLKVKILPLIAKQILCCITIRYVSLGGSC